jgi:hypothetical protein
MPAENSLPQPHTYVTNIRKGKREEKSWLLEHFSESRPEERAHAGGGENRRLNPAIRGVPSLENPLNEVHW